MTLIILVPKLTFDTILKENPLHIPFRKLKLSLYATQAPRGKGGI
jgi:hypothetical protein